MKIIAAILKMLVAGILAIAILSILLIPYGLTPLHHANPAQNTDYVWEPNSRWMLMTEGISWGKYDAQGYNNVNVIEDPDIIILGSSHMEAVNVLQHESAGSRLNELMAGRYTVYNMGISGHDFYKVCQYLPANLSLSQQPPKVAIIETSTVDLSSQQVTAAISGDIPVTPSHSTGLIATLQRIPFFRQLYKQLTGGLLDLFMPARTVASSAAATATAEEPEVEWQAYEDIFNYMAELEAEYGTQLVVFYHPTATLHADGSATFDDSVHRAAFAEAASRHNITFVDLTDDFQHLYNDEHQLPHGFITGSIGSGHLNAAGHRVAAEQLYEAISAMETEGLLCK